MSVWFGLVLAGLILLAWPPPAQADGSTLLPGEVNAIAVGPDGALYAGGHFDNHFRPSGQEPLKARHLAVHRDGLWHEVGGGVHASIHADVRALAFRGTELIVGGMFERAGKLPARGIAIWDGNRWKALGRGVAEGSINDIAVAANGDIYVVGAFSKIGRVKANGVARWNGRRWQPLGTGLSCDTEVCVGQAVVIHDGRVYVGGQFERVGSVPVNHVAVWDIANKSWSSLEGGVSGRLPAALVGPMVNALAVYEGDIYAAGSFAEAGSVQASNIARWDGQTWHSLGGPKGNGVSGTAFALAAADKLYVTGKVGAVAGDYATSFSDVGTFTRSGVGAWDGATWSAPYPRTDGDALAVDASRSARALVWHDKLLYVAGHDLRAMNVYKCHLEHEICVPIHREFPPREQPVPRSRGVRAL